MYTYTGDRRRVESMVTLQIEIGCLLAGPSVHYENGGQADHDLENTRS